MESVIPKRTLKNPVVDYIIYFLAKFCFSLIAAVDLYYFAAFLTDTALFSIAIVGTIQTVSTVIEMIFSFFYGALMTRIGQHLPWGMTRSWLLIAPPLASALFVFNFVRVSENEIVSAVVIIVTFILSHVIWSIGECALNSQMVNMTDDVHQRTEMSVNIGRGAQGSSLVFGFIAGFFLSTLFAGSPLCYAYLAIIFGIAYWIAFILLYIRSRGCEPTKEEYMMMREREKKVAEISSRNATLIQAYKAIFTSKNGILLLLANVFFYIMCFLPSAMMFYYFAYVVNGIAYMGTILSVRGLVSLIGSIFIVPLILKLCKGSKKKMFIVSSIFGMIGMILPWFPMFRTSLKFYVITCMITSLFAGGTTASQVGLMADLGVELSYKNKKDLAPFTISFLTFPLKIALMIKSVLVTLAFAICGYTAGMEIGQKQIDGFANAYLLWPVILSIVATIFIILYNNPEAKVQEMIVANAQEAEADAKRVQEILAARGDTE